jgi:hypothetical protein
MGKINNYTEFISESKLDLILESKIEYSDQFRDILTKIDLPISKYLIDIEYKDIDANSNYIDIDKEKEDIVYFKPDDKVKLSYTVVGRSNNNVSIDVANSGKYNIKNVKEPNQGKVGDVVHRFTLEEIMDLSPGFKDHWQYIYSQQHSVLHFKWSDGEVLINSNELSRNINKVPNSQIKIGRLVQSLLKNSETEFTPRQIEQFVDKYKAEIQIMGDVFDRFEITNGEDIRKWYLDQNYESRYAGTLGKSCMADDMCQPYFDIYTKNPKSVSLIIFRGVSNPDKISGRAILWTDNDGNKIMDRVYTNNSPDVVLFIEFANRNNFYHKVLQDSTESTPFELNDSKITDITINLDKNTYYTFPYMDTLKYYYYDSHVLSNKKDVSSSSSDYYYLAGTRGNIPDSCEFCGGSGRVDCPECDGSDPNCYYCEGGPNVDCPECQ